MHEWMEDRLARLRQFFDLAPDAVLLKDQGAAPEIAAPMREQLARFNIEWHVVNRENDVQTGDFEVRLYENDPNKRFEVIYGSITGLNTGFDVAGVQGPTDFFTQNFCRTLPPQNVSRTYAIMTPCPTPTATDSGSGSAPAGGSSDRSCVL